MEELTPAVEKFILHWGELGARWGLNRTVAQIHALLYLSPEPLPADQIASLLSVARSNVSTSLRELQGWGIVRVVHVLGDRRDHFESLKDVWELFSIILEERKRREIDPTIAVLQQCATELAKGGEADAYALGKVREMQGFFQSVLSFYQELRRLPTATLRHAIQLKSKLLKVVGGAAS